MNFFLNTRIGQALILAAVIGLCWWGFSSYYTRKGYERCRSEVAQQVAKANVEVVKDERARDATGDNIADKAIDRNTAVVKEVETATEDAEERIKVVYKDRWLTPTPGKCSVPVQPEVQDEINAAVRRSNGEGK